MINVFDDRVFLFEYLEGVRFLYSVFDALEIFLRVIDILIKQSMRGRVLRIRFFEQRVQRIYDCSECEER